MRPAAGHGCGITSAIALHACSPSACTPLMGPLASNYGRRCVPLPRAGPRIRRATCAGRSPASARACVHAAHTSSALTLLLAGEWSRGCLLCEVVPLLELDRLRVWPHARSAGAGCCQCNEDARSLAAGGGMKMHWRLINGAQATPPPPRRHWRTLGGGPASAHLTTQPVQWGW